VNAQNFNFATHLLKNKNVVFNPNFAFLTKKKSAFGQFPDSPKLKE